MFRLFAVFITAFLISGSVLAGAIGDGESEAAWLTDFEDAKQQAESTGRDILISFSGSDWCLPCMRLQKELFDTNEFRTFTDENLILLKLDFPAKKKNLLPEDQLKHNEVLAERYNKKGSFPLVVITDYKGNVKGYMQHPLSSSDAYIKSIQSILKGY